MSKKNIPIKLKTQPKPTRGRPRKASKVKKEASPPDIPETDENSSVADSEFIDAPIFKQPGEPLHQSQALRWNHKVNLIGEKVVDPLIHCCDKCKLPILIYGRMIPCKHVFCFDCARKTDKVCPRCEENVQRIEQSALGTVFVCSYGGPKHGDGGCRRTYLSHRDLQAHIYHRHMRTDSAKSSSSTSQAAGAGKPVVEQYTTSKVSSKSQHSTPIIEQYTTAAGRHATGESHLNLPHSRPSDAMYQQSILGQIPPQAQALPTQAMLQGPPPRLPLSQGQPPAQAIIPGQQADSYQLASMSALAPGRKTNLITVPLQDDSDYRRRDLAAGYGSLPPSTFSTSLPPPGGIAQAFPSMHQGPQATSIAGFPPSGPPPFTSPPLRTQLPVSSGVSVPISHPPPISVPTPNLATPPPPLLSGPRMPIQGGQPPRFGSPQGHFNDSYSQSAPGGQNTRGPWTGPPPQRSSGGQSQRSQSEGYQYYQ